MPNVLLIPGLLCTDALFAPQIAELSDVAAFMVADHQGHDRMEDIAASILNAAPEQFVIAGLSMGGYIAFEVMRQARDRVTGLVLLDTNARADRDVQQQQRQEFIDQALADGLEPVLDAFLPLMVHPSRLSEDALVGTIRKMALDTGVDAYVRQQKAILSRRDNRAFLETISCPTMVIVGADDVVTPVKVAREMTDGIRGSTLEIVEDCGHLATLERPDQVNALMRSFFQAMS